MRNRVEAVGNGNDTGREGDSLALESTRVARSFPPLVVRGYSLAEIGIERTQRSEDLSPALRVRHHGAPLFGCELGWIVEDVRERLVQLPDVVKEGNPFDAMQSTLVEAGGFPEGQRVSCDASYVSACNGIVGIDGIEQGLERGGAEALGLGADAVLAKEQPARGRANR